MEGKDHDGYCSGEDARDHDLINEYVVKTIDKRDLVESPHDLEWTDDGCTSGGSEYCHGFYQSYLLHRILEVQNAPSEMSKADIRRHIAYIQSKITEEDEEDEEDDEDEEDED